MTSREEEELTELKENCGSKLTFGQFWLATAKEFPILENKATVF